MELISTETGILVRGKDGTGRQRIQPKDQPFDVTEEYGKELLKTPGVKKYSKPGPKPKADPKPEPKPKE